MTNRCSIALEFQGRQESSLVSLQTISIDMNDIAQEKPLPVKCLIHVIEIKIAASNEMPL